MVRAGRTHPMRGPVLDPATTERVVGIEWPLVATSWRFGPRIHFRRALAEAHRLAGLGRAAHSGCRRRRSARPLPQHRSGAARRRYRAHRRRQSYGAHRRSRRRLADVETTRFRTAPAPSNRCSRRDCDRGRCPPGYFGRAWPACLGRPAFAWRCTSSLPAPAEMAAWRIVDAGNRDGRTLCAQLAREAACRWLAGGSRAGIVGYFERRIPRIARGAGRSVCGCGTAFRGRRFVVLHRRGAPGGGGADGGTHAADEGATHRDLGQPCGASRRCLACRSRRGHRNHAIRRPSR